MGAAFAQKHFPDDPLFKLSKVCLEAIPPVLQATGKVANPWPNVDALSGTCMQYYKLDQEDYYTVVFAVSRSLGVTANLVWSRLMGLPIERLLSLCRLGAVCASNRYAFASNRHFEVGV